MVQVINSFFTPCSGIIPKESIFKGVRSKLNFLKKTFPFSYYLLFLFRHRALLENFNLLREGKFPQFAQVNSDIVLALESPLYRFDGSGNISLDWNIRPPFWPMIPVRLDPGFPVYVGLKFRENPQTHYTCLKCRDRPERHTVVYRCDRCKHLLICINCLYDTLSLGLPKGKLYIYCEECKFACGKLTYPIE